MQRARAGVGANGARGTFITRPVQFPALVDWAKWIIVAAQTEVVEYLRSALAAQLELSSSQLESLIGAMETELVLALRQFFTPKQ